MYLYTDLHCHKLLVKNERVPIVFIILRKIMNVFLFLISLASIVLFALITNKFFPLLLVIVFLTTAVPIIMGDGVSAILRERYIVAYQMSRGLPAVYDIKKIIGGYCKIFPALWLFPSACLLLPGGSLFVGILPPILLMSLLIIKLIEHTWLTFGFSKKTYWIMHASALALLSFSAIILHSALGY